MPQTSKQIDENKNEMILQNLQDSVFYESDLDTQTFNIASGIIATIGVVGIAAGLVVGSPYIAAVGAAVAILGTSLLLLSALISYCENNDEVKDVKTTELQEGSIDKDSSSFYNSFMTMFGKSSTDYQKLDESLTNEERLNLYAEMPSIT